LSDRRPIPAVRPVGRDRPASRPVDLEATRVARLDPLTGRELPPTDDDGGKIPFASDPDATIIGALSPSAIRPRPITAEVVPPLDARLTSDVTVTWEAQSEAGPRRILRLLFGRRRRATIALAAASASILLATALLASRGAPASASASAAVAAVAGFRGDPQAPPTPAGHAADDEAPSADDDPGIIAHPADPDPEATSLAAEALADGRLDEARRHYRSLAAAHPQARAWSLALEILDVSGAGR